MTQTAINYATALYKTKVPFADVATARAIWEECEPLQNVLCSPVISKGQKHSIIEKIFPHTMLGFIKLVSDYGDASEFGEIWQAYEDYDCQQKSILKGTLFYGEKPDENHLNQVKKILKDRFHAKDIKLVLEEDSSLMGGFVLRIGDLEINESLSGSLQNLSQKLIRR